MDSDSQAQSPFEPAPGRRSIRLPDRDYSQPGAYFVTMVTHGRECLFGDVHHGELRLTDAGEIVWEVWNALPARYPQISLGAAVVMPNHFHGIIIINVMPAVGAIHELPLRQAPSQRATRRRMTIPLVVGYFKMNSAKRINEILDSRGMPVWQRNYYEHIIRDQAEHNRIHLYIEANPVNWVMDDENPEKRT